MDPSPGQRFVEQLRADPRGRELLDRLAELATKHDLAGGTDPEAEREALAVINELFAFPGRTEGD